ncbi:preprotein translocase subunit SecE [Flammeovirga yaeyamensis]|uniref:Preprotein translocase subunit SecE n=2 Tax=Flammeovirga yaeyamensis TaxID=367791 RepID=A0AAX1N5S1_9BACT|nr:preprotein translocase subunit SecE [Flammeovirga yaeyamensis]MBB3701097.1 preprotein translocase subunit SecE [Flammeovirga yaeyamensis]NMF38436.1 preprotein translocase subunit SecE [Flammeovirga yaeyamensis]QWG01565.1 preprotein translocase subunit SecE [Flammeovirga yaeyamensis]
MNKVIQFIKESYTEMTDNVSWMSFSEAKDSSILVLVASLVFALVIGGADSLINAALEFIYKAI